MPTETTIASRRLRCSIALGAGRRAAVRFERDGVVAAPAPRMAAHQAARGEPQTAPRAVPLDGFGRVMRAARIIPAGGRQDRRDQQLVAADHEGYAPAEAAAPPTHQNPCRPPP